MQAPPVVEERIIPRKYKVYESTNEEDPLNLLIDLLDNPNKFYSGNTFWSAMLLSWLVAGNAYAYKVRDRVGRVTQLIYIPHFFMWPIIREGSNDYVSYYRYQVDGKYIDYEPEDILHIRYMLDPVYQRIGLSPLWPALREICTENEAATFSAALLRNGAVPGMIITPKGENSQGFDTDQAERLRIMIPERFGGDRRGEPLIMDYPVEVSAPSFSPEQMILDKVRAIPVSRICADLGIPAMLLGLPDQAKTYSNMIDARRGFYENTVRATWASFSSQLTAQLLPDFQPSNAKPRQFRVGYYDADVPGLQEDKGEKSKRVRENWKAGGIKLYEFRAELGYKVDVDKNGDPVGPKSQDVFAWEVMTPQGMGSSDDGGETPTDGHDERPRENDPNDHPSGETDEDRRTAREKSLTVQERIARNSQRRQARALEG